MPAVLGGRRTVPTRRLALALAATAFLAGGAWWSWGYLAAEHDWWTAQEALKAQDVERALPHLARCVRVWPRDATVRFQAARAARQAGAYEEAEGHLTACENLRPSFSQDVWFERLLLRAQVGETEELGRVASGLEQSQPERFNLALEALARGYATTMQDSGAGRVVEELLRRVPGHVQALLLKAQQLDKFRNFSMALDFYQQVLDRTPDALVPRLGRLKALVMLGRHPEAVRAGEALRATHPDHPEVLFRLAQCRVDLGQPDEARGLLDHLLGLDPGHVEGLIERGRLEFHQGNLDGATAYLRRAAAAAPRNADALAALATCLKAGGQAREAEECLARREQAEVEYGPVARKIAQAAQRPEDVEGLLAVAEDLRRRGDWTAAVPWFFAVLQRERHQADVHRTLAEYFEGAGQPHRAARHRQLAEAARKERPS